MFLCVSFLSGAVLDPRNGQCGKTFIVVSSKHRHALRQHCWGSTAGERETESSAVVLNTSHQGASVSQHTHRPDASLMGCIKYTEHYMQIVSFFLSCHSSSLISFSVSICLSVYLFQSFGYTHTHFRNIL